MDFITGYGLKKNDLVFFKDSTSKTWHMDEGSLDSPASVFLV